jgi:hypothetical protein
MPFGGLVSETKEKFLMVSRKNKQDPVVPAEASYERRTQYTVTPEKFALTWNACESAEEVAEKLGMPKPIVLARVSNYRKMGIHLKKMRRKNSRRLDVDKINRLIAETEAAEESQTKEALTEQMRTLEQSLRQLKKQAGLR